MGDIEDPIIGFLDESSIQQESNKRRMINTPMIRYSPGKKRSKTIFGFMALDGEDVVMVSESSKSQDMIEFIEHIRWKNPIKSICIVLDNARIHWAKVVKQRAEELNIHFVYLPPYSPDLNPIEFGWKDLKRELSGIHNFDEAISKCINIALKFVRMRKMSYSSYWIDKFIKVER